MSGLLGTLLEGLGEFLEGGGPKDAAEWGMVWGCAFGLIGLVVGSVVPLFYLEEANLGPLLGLFVGPASAVVGFAVGVSLPAVRQWRTESLWFVLVVAGLLFLCVLTAGIVYIGESVFEVRASLVLEPDVVQAGDTMQATLTLKNTASVPVTVGGQFDCLAEVQVFKGGKPTMVFDNTYEGCEAIPPLSANVGETLTLA